MVTSWLTLLDKLTNRIKLIGKSACAPIQQTLDDTPWFGIKYVSSLISLFKRTLTSKSANTLTNETEEDENKLLFTLIGAEMNKLFCKMDSLQLDMSENMRYIKQQQNELTKENKQLLNDKIETLNNMNKALISENEEITQELNGIKEEENKLEYRNNEYLIKTNNEMNIQIKQLNNKLNKQIEENKELIEEKNKYISMNKQLNNDKNKLNEKLNGKLNGKMTENNGLILKRNICPYIKDAIYSCADSTGYDSYESNENINTQNNTETLYIKQVSNIKSIFEYKKHLSKGGTCTVTLVEAKNKNKSNNNQYALKEISKSDSKYHEELFAKEVQILQLLSGQKYVIDYFDSYQTQTNYYLATTYCSGGSLLDYILKMKTFSETECMKYIYQILSAIEYMHSKNLVHRDLKLDNIIFDAENDIVKIIDFGDCEIIENDETYKELVGTLYYLSPECKRERKGWEMKKSDMWSIGVMLYILLSGQLPFPAYDNQEETIKSIEKGVFEWPNNVQLSALCKSFINGLLCKSTEKRFDAKTALKHKWIGK